MKLFPRNMPGSSARLQLCAALCLLAASTALAQEQPTAPATPPAAASTPAPAADVTITQPLLNQPNAKPVTRKQAHQADDAYLAGSAFLEKNQPEKAEAAFERAVKLNPEKSEYTVAAAIARENVVNAMIRKSQVMRSAGDPMGANALLLAADKIDPQNQLITEHMPQPGEPRVQIEPYFPSGNGTEQVALEPVVEFNAPVKTTQSFHFRADAHEVLRRVLLAYGLKAQFNDDVPAESVRLDIDDVTFDQMLPVVEMMTRTFLTPVDPTTALVLKDTQENRQQHQHLALETIYMPGFTPTQIQESSALLQQVLDMQHIVVSPGSGTISIRAPMDMLRVANYELADLLDGGSQLILEMKVYTIDKTNSKNIGLDMTTSVTAFNFYSQATQIIGQFQSQISAAIANGLIPATATPLQILEGLFGLGLLNNNPLVANGILGTVGGGLTYTGISASTLPSINFGLNESEAKSLEDIQLSIGDQKTATFRVGSKYPIITASYSSGISSSALSGLTSTQLAAIGGSSAAAALASATQASVPQIQYEDLGLTLKAVPTVMRSGNVNLQIDLKIEALAGSALNSIPVLASRALTSVVTLQQGQTAVLVSSMSKQESNAVAGIPLLSELPGFQNTTDSDRETDTSELVITLTPRLVRRGHDRIAGIPLAFPHAAAEQARNDE